jgi:hypothetical protein
MHGLLLQLLCLPSQAPCVPLWQGGTLRMSALLLRISALLLRMSALLLRMSALLLRMSALLLRLSALLLRADYVRFHHPFSFTLSNLAWSMIEFPEAYVNSGSMEAGLAAVRWGRQHLLPAPRRLGAAAAAAATGARQHNIVHSFNCPWADLGSQ